MAVTFTTTNGSTTVTVSDNDSGAKVGDYVVFENVSGLSGANLPTLLEERAQYVTKLNGTASYNIELSAAADGNNTAAGQADALYYLESGSANAVIGPGWGAGTWGRSTWGSAISQVAGQGIRLWSVDNFGENIIVNLYDGGLYYYFGNDSIPRLTPLQHLGGASNAAVPTVSRFVAVSDTDRHVICFGCNPFGSTVQDKLQVRWSSQEDPFDWLPTSTNTAGDLRISQGTEISAIVQTRREILVWTDRSLHSMQFTGAPFYFGQALLADNVRIVGPNSAIAVNDVVYWMGSQNFYRYDGRVQVLPCSVREYVFGDINLSQNQKIYAGTITGQNEIWWYYPSGTATENDRYIVYNYLENLWYYGTLSRTAMIDASSTVRIYPQATGDDGYLYDHERGLDDGSTSPASAINAYIESSDFDIGQGDRFMLTQRIIPDLTFNGSAVINPSVDFSVKVRNFPGVSYSEEVSGNTSRTATSPVEQYTDQLYLRARGRAAAVKVESTGVGVKWRLGAPRMDLKPDGRR
jgi:hypothetical protein